MALTHPAAEQWPLMSADELGSLVESMKANGYDSAFPIWRYQGSILDGRNRLAASEIAGVEPTFVDLPDDADPWQASIRFNGARRNIHNFQRAAIVLELQRLSGQWQRAQGARIARANKARAEKAKEQVAQQRRGSNGTFGELPGPVSRDTAPGDQATEPERERDVLAKLSGTSPTTAGRVLRVQAEAPERMPELLAGKIGPSKILKELDSKPKRKPGPRGPGNEIDAKVTNLYPRRTIKQIADQLALKPRQVTHIASRLGLKKGKGKKKAPLAPIMRAVDEWMTVLDMWVDDDASARSRSGALLDDYDSAEAGLRRVRNRIDALLRVLRKERSCLEEE